MPRKKRKRPIISNEKEVKNLANRRVPDPTRRQIKKRCKEVRDSWDEVTRQSRIVDPTLLPEEERTGTWEVPIISMRSLGIDIVSTGNEGLPGSEEYYIEDSYEM